MDESQIISELIGYIYDAPLDTTLWSLVLQKTCAFVQGQTAALMAQHPGKAQFFAEWGTVPRFLESYQKNLRDDKPGTYCGDDSCKGRRGQCSQRLYSARRACLEPYL